MFHGVPNGDLFSMNVFAFAQQYLSGLQLDDSSVAMIALLAGMVAGYWINGRHEQLKARRAEVARRQTRGMGRRQG